MDADARTDIFAFGAVLYEMLTGNKAFEGKSHASLIAAILEHDPPPISTALLHASGEGLRPMPSAEARGISDAGVGPREHHNKDIGSPYNLPASAQPVGYNRGASSHVKGFETDSRS